MEEQNKPQEKFPTPLNMGLEEFVVTIINANNDGAKATQEHKEKFKYYKSKAKNAKTGYHAAGTKDDCEICLKIIDAHNTMMELEQKAFGLWGIPLDNLLSAIKITKGVLLLDQKQKMIELQKLKDGVKDGN